MTTNHERQERKPASKLRRKEVSEEVVYTFYVEGILDIPFYKFIIDKIIKHPFVVESVINWEFDEDKGSTKGGGKSKIKKLYEIYKGKEKIGRYHFFIVDKDIDDILDKKITDDVIIYTDFYNIENYIYYYADEISLISSTTALSFATIVEQIQANWKSNLLVHMTKWIELCILSSYCRVNIAHYSTKSIIHKDHFGELLHDKYEDTLKKIISKSKLDRQSIEEKHVEIAKIIGELNSDELNRYFHGKWYSYYLNNFFPNIFNSDKEKMVLESLIKDLIIRELYGEEFLYIDNLRKGITQQLLSYDPKIKLLPTSPKKIRKS